MLYDCFKHIIYTNLVTTLIVGYDNKWYHVDTIPQSPCLSRWDWNHSHRHGVAPLSLDDEQGHPTMDGGGPQVQLEIQIIGAFLESWISKTILKTL